MGRSREDLVTQAAVLEQALQQRGHLLVQGAEVDLVAVRRAPADSVRRRAVDGGIEITHHEPLDKI